MLDLPRYLLGAAEVLALAGFALLAGSTVRRQLLPRFSGPPAWLATGVVGLALLIWVAELLGTLGWFAPLLYVLAVAVVGMVVWTLLPRVVSGWGRPSPPEGCGGQGPDSAGAMSLRPEQRVGQGGRPHPGDRTRGPAPDLVTLVAMAIAIVATIHFAAGVKTRLNTGMTGFDSTWYHGSFAAGFFQSGDTWGLHFIAPQFLAWFYPANGEIFHTIGMVAFDRDVLSPLLNLGWFLGCLLALWCIGRPYGVGPWSLALGAIALSVPALSDQAGEARNDIVGIFFLLTAVAIALNASAILKDWGGYRTLNPSGSLRPGRRSDERGLSRGALLIAGLGAGLAAGTKLNFLLPAAVLIAGFAFIAPKGSRWRALWVSGLAALAGGGYWYLRNLAHTGNPLPWFDHLGPISLPAPDQALGGREGHSMLGYLSDGTVWSDWFLPGLHNGLTIFWPFLVGLAFGGLALATFSPRAPSGRGRANDGPGGDDGVGSASILRLAGVVGLAAALAWLIAPTSASGPDGMPRGFESGLRYLTPALVLGLALLPAALALMPISLPVRFRIAGMGSPPNGRILKMPASLGRHLSGRGGPHTRATAMLCAALIGTIAIGYPIQRHYLENRYANPTFAAPGLNAAFKWASTIRNARIATTSTRQYPLYGLDLSNRVQYIGEERSHGGFTAPISCPAWRRLLNAGHYDYVITTRDRIEPGKPAYPETDRWTEGPESGILFRKPPTVVFRLNGLLDPASCRY